MFPTEARNIITHYVRLFKKNKSNIQTTKQNIPSKTLMNYRVQPQNRHNNVAELNWLMRSHCILRLFLPICRISKDFEIIWLSNILALSVTL